jgi:hypothetical protein
MASAFFLKHEQQPTKNLHFSKSTPQTTYILGKNWKHEKIQNTVEKDCKKKDRNKLFKSSLLHQYLLLAFLNSLEGWKTDLISVEMPIL